MAGFFFFFFLLKQTLKYRLIEEVILLSCPHRRLPWLPWLCWAVLHSGPHASPASSPIHQAQVQQNRQANLPQPSSAYSHSPGCAHHHHPNPSISWCLENASAHTAHPPHGFVMSALLHSPHSARESPLSPAFGCRGPGCRQGPWMQAGSWKGDAQLFQFWMLHLHVLCLSLSHELCSTWMGRARRVSCPLVLPPCSYAEHSRVLTPEPV